MAAHHISFSLLATCFPAPSFTLKETFVGWEQVSREAGAGTKKVGYAAQRSFDCKS